MRSDPEADTTWAGSALTGVMVGSLMAIWSGLWLIFLRRNPPENDILNYFAVGLLLTGLAFLIGGFVLGTVRRHAQHEAEEVEQT